MRYRKKALTRDSCCVIIANNKRMDKSGKEAVTEMGSSQGFFAVFYFRST